MICEGAAERCVKQLRIGIPARPLQRAPETLVTEFIAADVQSHAPSSGSRRSRPGGVGTTAGTRLNWTPVSKAYLPGFTGA